MRPTDSSTRRREWLHGVGPRKETIVYDQKATHKFWLEFGDAIDEDHSPFRSLVIDVTTRGIRVECFDDS